MVVMDERSWVPPVDAAARERLAVALAQEGVVAAMLFGSKARGTPGPLSDIDIAIWHDPGLDDSRRFRLQLDLIGAAEAALGTHEIDLVMLNGAPPLLRQRRFARCSARRFDAGSTRGPLVEDRRIEARLLRLEEMIERLEEVGAGGKDAYLGDSDLRAMTRMRLSFAGELTELRL